MVAMAKVAAGIAPVVSMVATMVRKQLNFPECPGAETIEVLETATSTEGKVSPGQGEVSPLNAQHQQSKWTMAEA